MTWLRHLRPVPGSSADSGNSGSGLLDWLWERLCAAFPAVVDPEPIGRVTTDSLFKGAVDIKHDGCRGAGLAMFVSGNFIAKFDAPLPQAGAKAKSGVQRQIEAQAKNGRGLGGVALVAEEGQAHAVVAGVLVGKQAKKQMLVANGGAQGRALGAAFEEEAAGSGAQLKQ